MSNGFEFSHATGQELVELLARRAKEKSLPESEYFAAVLGAALVLLAEVLRRPIEHAQDRKRAADKMIDLSVKWLRRLLQPLLDNA